MKGRIARNTGGVVAKNVAPTDVYAGANSEVVKAAKKRKHGGKTMDKAEGESAKMHAGRKPRKSGGRLAGTDWASAQKGTAPKGRKLEMN
jgi:hypothetical protein